MVLHQRHRIGQVIARDPHDRGRQVQEGALLDNGDDLRCEAGGQRRLLEHDRPPGPTHGLARSPRRRAGPGCAGRAPRPRSPPGRASSAASSATWVIALQVMTVTSVPARAVRACPSGTTTSPSGTSSRTSRYPLQRLEEQHGVGIADRRQQHPLGVGCGRRHDHLQPRHLGEDRLETVGVELRGAHPAAVRRAERHLGVIAAVGAVSPAGELVADLVERLKAETQELQLGHRHEAGGGQADRRPDDRGLRHRHVDDPLDAERVLQPVRCPEHPARLADVLAEHHHSLVARHLVGERRADRLDHAHLGHQWALFPASSATNPSISLTLASQRQRLVGVEVVEHRRGSAGPTAATPWTAASICASHHRSRRRLGVVVPASGVPHPGPEADQGISGHPGLLFGCVDVARRIVGRRVRARVGT